MIETLRPHGTVIRYVILAIAVLAMVAMPIRQSQWNDHNLCQESRKNRQALRDVIVLATEDTGGGGLNLTGIPSFDALEPEMQQYLADLEALANSDSGSGDADDSFRRRALDLLPLEDCGHLRPWP